MRIGIIGAGQVGGTLARHLCKLGHHVSIANSRGRKTLLHFANDVGAKAVSIVEIPKAADVVILAIPTKAVTELPKNLFLNAPDNIVIVDTGNYHPELRDGYIDEIEKGTLDSVWVSKQIGRPVIKAFNNILATSLMSKGTPKGAAGRTALSISGDSAEAKAIVLQLIEELGFDSIDDGKLENSWRQQTGSPAYCHDLDLVSLKFALDKAERSQTGPYRAKREDDIRKMIAAQVAKDRV